MKIAICDDRKEDRDTLRALLEAYGQDFEIREYESGEALRADIEAARECRIIFLDINMEGMDGHGKRKLFPSQVALIRHYDSIPVFSPLRIFPKYSIS